MLPLLVVPLLIGFLTYWLFIKKNPKTLNGKHVVITGGSSGIGKSAAVLCARKGAHVTIIARNASRLAKAKKEIESACISKTQKVTTASVDVSIAFAVTDVLDNLENYVGPIYMLINCAGMAICGTVENFREQDVKALFNVNYFGTLYPIQAVIPKFKTRKEGIIVITASQVALMGMYGYSIYSSCKFALRGLAESINMELKPYNVSVTLSLPPDTETPGYETENVTKPEETKRISASGGLFSPEEVAEKLLDDALDRKFFSFVGFESFILTSLCVGMAPFSNIWELFLQTLIMGPLRLIAAGYVLYFDHIVKKCHLSKERAT